MKAYETNRIRSIALAGHGHAGKTSLGDAIARVTGLNTRLGSVIEKTSLLDYEPEEQERGGSLATHFLTCEYDGYKIHVADTPGDGDFMHDGLVSVQAMDSAVLVVSAVDGIQNVHEKVNARCAKLGISRVMFVNKLDRERASHEEIVGDAKELFGIEPVLVQLPIGAEDTFRGVVDLVNRKAFTYAGDEGIGTEGPIPADMQDDVDTAIEVLTEVVAMTDDELVEKYLEAGELTQEELRAGLNKAVTRGALMPVLLGCATKNIGVDRLLWITRSLPDASQRAAFKTVDGNEVEVQPDGPLVALCFKTIIDPFVGHLSVLRVVSGTMSNDSHPVNLTTDQTERLGTLFHLQGKKHVTIDRAVPGDIVAIPKLKATHTGETLSEAKKGAKLNWLPAPEPMIASVLLPKTRADEDKVRVALERLLAEDPGLIQTFDEVTKEIVLNGMGANHIAMSVAKMERKYGVHVGLQKPTIPYRETISGTADVRYRHKKQTGGAGQFGEVSIRVGPNKGLGFEFFNKTVGGVIPSALIPSVEKGVRQQLDNGSLAGFPTIDVRVELYDGKSHPVDSKDIAFQIAGRQAIKQAIMQAKPTLLEPIYDVEVVAPEDLVGDIMGDMNTRRARIQSMEGRGRNSVVKAFVPLAEMLEYAPTLKSITGGRGSYHMQFSSYEPVPHSMQDKLVEDISRMTHDDDH